MAVLILRPEIGREADSGFGEAVAFHVCDARSIYTSVTPPDAQTRRGLGERAAEQ